MNVFVLCFNANPICNYTQTFLQGILEYFILFMYFIEYCDGSSCFDGNCYCGRKEKNTLRTLMLNNVQGTEILFAKAAICLFCSSSSIMSSSIWFLIYQWVTLPYQLIGLLVGKCYFLYAWWTFWQKNQMSAGLLSIPFMLIWWHLYLFPWLQWDCKTKLSTCYQPMQWFYLFDVIAKGEFPLNTIENLPLLIPLRTFDYSLNTIELLSLAWFVISFVLFNIAYQKE